MTTRRRLNVDRLLGIAAVITSLCALGITFYQAYLQRIQQYASVMPVLQFYNTSRTVSGPMGYALMCENKGLGPAFIESVDYYYKAKRYDSVDEWVRAILPSDTTRFTTTMDDGWIIPQDKSVAIVEVSSREGIKAHRNLIQEFSRIVVRYRSVYGETWELTFPADPRKSLVKIE